MIGKRLIDCNAPPPILKISEMMRFFQINLSQFFNLVFFKLTNTKNVQIQMERSLNIVI